MSVKKFNPMSTVTAKRGGVTREFTAQVWKDMPEDVSGGKKTGTRYGWKQVTEMPEELKSEPSPALSNRITAARALIKMSESHIANHRDKLDLPTIENAQAANKSLAAAIEAKDLTAMNDAIAELNSIWFHALTKVYEGGAKPKEEAPDTKQSASAEPKQVNDPAPAPDYTKMSIEELRAEITKRGLKFAPAHKEASLIEILLNSDKSSDENKA